MSEPTIGRIVHYRLCSSDAERINRRRKDAYDSGSYRDQTGYMAHVGNQAIEGQEVPAVIVRVWDGGLVNLHVLLDGNDTFWATSRREGTDVAQWTWPEVK